MMNLLRLLTFFAYKHMYQGLPTLPENEIELTLGAAANDPPTTVALRPEFQRDRLSQQSPEEVLYMYINCMKCAMGEKVDIPGCLLTKAPSLLNS
jgi:hypothetical protein